MLKKNCPTKTRVSFVNMMAGNDVDKVLKRVANELENMMQNYMKYGHANQALINNNAKSWLQCNDLMFGPQNSNNMQSTQRNSNNPINKTEAIQYNFQYILCAVYPLHLLLFWMYFIFNNNTNFNGNVTSFIIIALCQFMFIVISSLVIFVSMYCIYKIKSFLEYSNPSLFADCINCKIVYGLIQKQRKQNM